MAEIDTFDPAALDRFIEELMAAGFDADPGTDGRYWTGPIHPCLEKFTTTDQMTIEIRDGWPFRSPQVRADALQISHTGHDIVCLWRPDDHSLEWMTLDSIMDRIEEFCVRGERGFEEQDEMLDAWLAFEDSDLAMATFDLPSLKPEGFTGGQFGDCHAVQKSDYLIQIRRGKGAGDSLKGRWYYRADIAVPPPTLTAIKANLTSSQLKNLERGLERLIGGDSRGIDFAVVITKRESQRLEAVTIRFSVEGNELKSTAMEPAPNDEQTLILRAGPHAEALRSKHVVQFGLGAIGGHAALLL
ncbi:MAG: hypothetical protein ACC652_13435, partial [Acidimicrobiales bacterium]